MSDSSFIDLRLNRETVDHNESFWPSFTDIMTVIVMIFLMAMVVLLLRNMELVAELQSTVEAERAAAELARSNIAEKESLSAQLSETRDLLESISAQLASTEADFRATRKDLVRTTGERDRLAQAKESLTSELVDTRNTLSATQSTLTQTEAQREQLRTDLEKLQTEASELQQTRRSLESTLATTEAQLATATDDAATKTEQLAAAREESGRTRDLLDEARTENQRREKVIEEQFAAIDSLESESAQLAQANAGLREQLEALTLALSAARRSLESATTNLRGTEKELDSLRGDYQAREEELQVARQQISVTDQRLADLQGEFGDLRIKYDRLIKPARSAANKYVVEVRYFKSRGAYRIQYRAPGEAGFEDISKGEMNRRLKALSAEKPDDLYVRVIIPDDSGLSYSEAWKFTNGVHNRYDYYFREPPPEPDPE